MILLRANIITLIQKKNPINYTEDEENIKFETLRFNPLLPKLIGKGHEKIVVDFISHAFITIKGPGFKFAMDPWAEGPAFVGGWWLKRQPMKGWKKRLNECDFIYISHNHPDHLNLETLKHVKKNMLFIIPNFISKSVEKILKREGYTNFIKFEFQNYYQFKKTPLLLTILKSGDFRDDSGLYFTFGEFSFLSTVDANNLNGNNFPKDITLLLSSFAGGGTGYPLCFDLHTINEKQQIIKRNRKSFRNIVIKNIKSIKPKYYLPYAGFFSEDANRDLEIKNLNHKNSINDYESRLSNQIILNVEKKNHYVFKGTNLVNSEKKYLQYKKEKPELWISKHSKKASLSHEAITTYFLKSCFHSQLCLYLSLTDDNFNLTDKNFRINFSKNTPDIHTMNNVVFEKDMLKKTKNNLLFIKARNDSFIYMIKNRLPWEELLIGFQCRIYRKPNVYNSDFWFHFTNVYF